MTLDNLYKQELELLKKLPRTKSEEEREAIGRTIERINEEMEAIEENQDEERTD